MGDTLYKMATEISMNDSNFGLWDKGQLVVVLSRTKIARNTRFVGGKHDALMAIRTILVKRTQWSDYMDEVLELITINSETPLQHNRTFDQISFLFRICDLELPTRRTGYVYIY